MFHRRRCAGGRGPYVDDLKPPPVNQYDMTDDRIKDTRAARFREAMADGREVVLDWREAHANLSDAPSDGAEAARLRAEMRQLREEYARLIEEARRCGGDVVAGSQPSLDD